MVCSSLYISVVNLFGELTFLSGKPHEKARWGFASLANIQRYNYSDGTAFPAIIMVLENVY